MFLICFVSQGVEQDAKNRIKNIIPSGSYKFLNLAHNLYTKYPIFARRAWPAGRVRRASKGILHTSSQYNYYMHTNFKLR